MIAAPVASIPVRVTGASITLAGTSASATIPNTSAGTKPRIIRVATTTAAYVRFGVGAQTAVNTDLLVTQYDSVLLNIGATDDTIAGLQAATGGVLIVTPVEV